MNVNHGVILTLDQPFIHLGGVGDTLPVVNSGGDWRDYCPTLERQNRNGLETMSCVSQSLTNTLEIALRRQGVIVDFDERDLARRSGTTRAGNTFANVYNAAMAGLASGDDEEWTDEDTWDEYYAVPKGEDERDRERAHFHEVFDLGNIVYVGNGLEAMREGLKRAPLWACNSYHAFVITAIEGNRIYVHDSYPSRDSKGNGWFDSNIIEYSAIVPIDLKRTMETKPLIELPENTIVQLTEPGYPESGAFPLHIDGKLYVDDGGRDNLLRTAMVRTAGKGLTKKVWDSFPKYNLKNERI